MGEDRERLTGDEELERRDDDVEAHKLDPERAAGDEELERRDDDVEAHKLDPDS